MMDRVKRFSSWLFKSKTKNNEDQPKENWADKISAISDARVPTSKESKLADGLGSSYALDPYPLALPFYLETKSYLAPNYLTPMHEDNIFKPMSPLRTVLQILGAVPYVYDEEEREYRLKWSNPNALRTIINALYLSVLLVTTSIGLFTMLVENVQEKHDEEKSDFSTKIMGAVLIAGCLVNGCTAIVSILYYGHTWCKILNNWNNLVIAAEIDPMKGLKPKIRKFMIFLAIFSFIMIILTLAGKPKVFVLVVDGVAESMFMVPKDILEDYASLATFIRVITCLVCLHIFAVFKGSLFSFTTNCHMLKNGFASWNTQLNNALEDIWRRRSRTRGRLGLLVQSHFHLVKMVRETESIFGPMLQCYYASTVVILCTELYLLAYRIGTKEYAADGVITTALMTLQTTVVFVQVSLAAAAVEEEAQDSLDILRRGIPFDASDRDKFSKEELTIALTATPVCITGGKFFTINRPFIITVMSAVITYFIVMIQFMQPGSETDPSDSSLLNSTIDANLTLN